MGIKEDILNASKKVGINPYTDPFKASTLGLNANKYGSFSDYCSETESASGKYSKTIILKVVERNKSKKPFKYLLL
ncbi:hypothetical protein Arnit_2273 [Arcobacter nitrofigilis DSM 7299]|uniref:Uncharacterized protein n=1 Tax=Arcobacter nitrofigilis (strain ATCC 33309 / DSM 7299 / CCUG 15893 / LMG 7604 / NCTC 12251 / CI) TaxID=572480 RepID=D5V0W2_ARCNC|nr:hypothetical protein [Arcobacter nitrofigilis]ADG93924.1 hypothetical protein Arnit_2273 [Arcobacter nitrofigilis DSM 7299]